MGPSKCSLAINFVIFQLEFHILCEVTKLGVILLNFVDIGKILRQLRLAALKKNVLFLKIMFFIVIVALNL